MSLKTNYIEIAPNLFIKTTRVSDRSVDERAVKFITTVGPTDDQKAILEHASFKELLSYAMIDELIPEQYVSPFYDMDNVNAWLRAKLNYSPTCDYSRHRVALLKATLSTRRWISVTSFAACDALDSIVSLRTKYRHSHTLRKQFRDDFSVLFPAAAKLVELAKPMKNAPVDDLDTYMLEPRERCAYDIFTGTIPKEAINERAYLEVLTNSADPFNP